MKNFNLVHGDSTQMQTTSPLKDLPGFKDTNPKDAVGIKKPPISTVPLCVMQEVGVAMLEGARKYRRHNYRVAGVLASVYFDATIRHLFDWFEGRDIDPDSGLSEVTKAIASLVVLRDAMINDKWTDDRAPSINVEEHRARLQGVVDGIFEKYPEGLPPYVKGDNE